MNIIAKLRKAVLGYDNPLSRIILFGLSKMARWTPDDYTALSKAGYENCITAYACINYIGRAAAGIEWTATVGKKDAPDHSVLRLLERPNDREGRRTFMSRGFASLLISGNRYIMAGRIASQPPLALWVPRPDLMAIVPGAEGRLIDRYEYGKTSEPLKIDPSLILHTKLFHPTDDWYGLSPLSVASHAVDISNMANEWNMRLLQNDMRPPGGLSTEGKLTDDQYKRIKSTMKNEWQGFENAGEPLLLEGGLKWVNFMLTAKEMDWLNTTKVTKRDICTVYNIDPCLIGDNEYATYSNKVEARKGAYEDVIIPFMEELRDDFNLWLAPMYGDGVRLDINRDKIPALQESREKQYTYLQGTWWLRLDELRKLTGQDPVGGPVGEMILIPAGRIPVDIAALGDTQIDDADPSKLAAGPSTKLLPAAGRPGFAKGFWQDDDLKKALWDNFVIRVKARERGIDLLAKAYLKAQAKAVGDTIRKMTSIQEVRTAQLVDTEVEADRFKRMVGPWYSDAAQRAVTAGLQMTKGELPEFDMKADFYNLTAAQVKILEDMVVYSGTKISESTMKLVLEILKSSELDNATVDELARKISDTLDAYGPFRSQRIARTETAKVENWGNLEGFKASEFVGKKGWGCSFVPDSRISHQNADGQIVGVNEDFDVGGKAMGFPGDPRGGVENDVNCLCFMFPEI